MNLVYFLAGMITGVVGIIIWALVVMSSKGSRKVDDTERWAEIQTEKGHDQKEG